MYKPKNINFGFIILNPESNPSLLKSTVNSIKSKFNVPFICATEKSVKAESLKEMKAVCPTYKGQETYTSLMNVGMKHAPAEWNFFIMAGTYIQPKLNLKFSTFIENEKDILFPIVENKCDFLEGTINGLLVHKNCFKEVGNMAEIGPYEICKLMWALDAVEKGYKFKAILGAKLC